MKVAVPSLSPLFRSDTQGRLLAAVFVAPDEEHSITALAKRAGTSVPTALREIDRAESAGVVTVRRLGNTRLVRANTRHLLYDSIHRLVSRDVTDPQPFSGKSSDTSKASKHCSFSAAGQLGTLAYLAGRRTTSMSS